MKYSIIILTVIVAGTCTISNSEFLSQMKWIPFLRTPINNYNRIHLKSNADKEKTVFFILYTRRTPKGEIISEDNIEKTTINPKLPTKIFAHGWTQSGTKYYINDTAQAVLKNADSNFIAVDWQQLAGDWYPGSVKNTRLVGNATGKLVVKLHQDHDLNLNDVHVIGHSLGAHVAGFTGKTVFTLTGSKIARITGLDPAGPLFETPILMPTSQRLSNTDAMFVDIIHTDASVLGFAKAIGHVDFYPNSGFPLQPGCSGITADSTLTICSHARAVEFFLESINSNKFLAQKCKSWKEYQNKTCENTFAKMGFHPLVNVTGKYYLETNSESPFAKPTGNF